MNNGWTLKPYEKHLHLALTPLIAPQDSKREGGPGCFQPNPVTRQAEHDMLGCSNLPKQCELKHVLQISTPEPTTDSYCIPVCLSNWPQAFDQ